MSIPGIINSLIIILVKYVQQPLCRQCSAIFDVFIGFMEGFQVQNMKLLHRTVWIRQPYYEPLAKNLTDCYKSTVTIRVL